MPLPSRRLRPFTLAAPALLLVTSLLGCASLPAARVKAAGDAVAAAPLGPSYVLIPLPGDDDSLLGRILESMPEPGRSLDEVARPNPCEDKLAPVQTKPSSNTFEDAQEMSAGAQARAVLGVFGFQGDASQASHFLYKLDTEKRATRRDTNDYVTCCKSRSCGVGYVSELVYGEGEYSTGEETTAHASVTVSVEGAGGNVSLKILHRRKVKGWLAALVTLTDAKAAARLGPLGLAQEAGITELGLPEQLKEIYEHNKMVVDAAGGGFEFELASGEKLTENEFVRRYRSLTGSADLDDAEKRRNWGWVALWGGVTLVGGGIMYGGTLATKCASALVFNGTDFVCQSGHTIAEGGYGVIGVGGVVAAVGLSGVVVSLLRPDGSTTDHSLTDADARLYATRYNRALLRKAVKDVSREAKGPVEIEPLIGAGWLGMSGRF